MDLRLGRASMERLKRKLCSTGGYVKDESTSAASSSSFFSDELFEKEEQEAKDSKRKDRMIYTLRENPRKSCKLPDPTAVYGGESDTDQSRYAAPRRRSKRNRRVAADPETLSSVSDASPEDDAAAIAMCLVMLSRDTWQNRRGSREEEPKQQQHRCEVCNKVFRSSQALGGHRVTHRKLNQLGKIHRKNAAANGEKIFECPYCFKVFASGQALGGHKRSHVMGPNSDSAAAAISPTKTPINLIDLNLPAPEEEEDGSVVSDAEITDHPIKTNH